MTRILTDISFIKNPVSASTPPSGFGTVYASGSDLYFINDSGSLFNITSNNIIREYTSSDTWTRPAGIKEVLVICVGAGGGGGSGYVGSTSTDRRGGGGGGGGAFVSRRISSASLGTSEIITIGAGGTTGSAVTAAINTNGNPGGLGADSSFGSLVVAKGGGSGAGGALGGSTGGANGGLASSCTPIRSPCALNGVQRVAPVGTTAASPNGMDGSFAAPAGGMGGAISTGNGFRTGGAGGGVHNEASLTAGGAGGATAGTNGTAGVDNINRKLIFDINTLTTNGIGTGGGGGASVANSTTAGSGANGGNYGAGGGGGGACLLNGTSGAGGRGASGLVIIVEYY
jgi:hypothetical protein